MFLLYIYIYTYIFPGIVNFIYVALEPKAWGPRAQAWDPGPRPGTQYFGRKPVWDERYGDIVAPVEIAAKFCIYSSA